MPSTNNNLLAIVGPTAVGKTLTSIALAERLQGEIISADSRYFYRGMDIGTAKPSPAEQARVPHHLIDVTEPDQPWSLAQFRDTALQLIGEINQRSHLPILVGGTGQYIQALLEGWTIPKREANLELRTELEAFAAEQGPDVLFERLRAVDPIAAQTIDKRNIRRVVRALEVTLTTGEPFSAQRQKSPPDFNKYIVGLTLPRDKLYQRIDTRVDGMLAAGLVAETQALAAKGYGWKLPAMSAIGYKQIGQCLRGEIELAEAVRLIKHDTRRFVRQQGNWFRLEDPSIHWYEADKLDIDELAAHIRGFFEGKRL